MNLIQQITDDANQTQNLVLPNNAIVTINMRFVVMQYGWFFNSITYGNFVINGLRITNSPNMLQQFINQIPFGIACYSAPDNREPTQIEDFASGASQLYLLSQAEVQAYAGMLASG